MERFAAVGLEILYAVAVKKCWALHSESPIVACAVNGTSVSRCHFAAWKADFFER